MIATLMVIQFELNEQNGNTKLRLLEPYTTKH